MGNLKVAVIVPCYNEEAVINESYRRTKAALDSLSNPTEIIYINDGSQDRTRSLLDEIASKDQSVKVLHFSRNFGHQPLRRRPGHHHRRRHAGSS